MNNKGQDVVKTLSRLQSERAQLDSYWDKCFEYTFPLRGQGFENRTVDGEIMQSAAANDQSKIFDTTATDSCRLLAASMISGLTPSNSIWFNLGIPGIDRSNFSPEANSWLESSTMILHELIHGSNYDSEAYEFFTDITAGGMAGLYIEMDDNGGFSFEYWPLSDLWVQETLGKRIDTVYRILYYTPSQAVAKFGKNKLPDTIKQEYDRNPECTTKFQFIHAIRPRMKNGKQASGKQVRTMPWESLYVCRKTGTVVNESGYMEFPVVIPRWMKIPKSVYAVGPLDAALPDVLTVNKIKQMVLTNGEMQIAGTFVAKEDGVLNPNTVRIGARKVIFAADTKNIQPLASGGDFKVGEWLIAQLQEQIRKVLMSDQLQPTDKKYASATEVQIRVQLIRRLLGPVYSRFQSEFMAPLLQRCFGLAYRNGYLGEVPRDLAEFPLSPEYQSPLARAQKQEDVDQMVQFEQQLIPMAQVDPDIVDLYDMDKAARKKSQLLGVPTDVMRSDKEVQKLRRKRAEREQQVQQQMMMQAASEEQQ